VLVTTAENANANELRQFGRQSGANELMVPNDIIKIEDMPVLGSGKTDYVSARRIAVERLGLDAAA
jgi:acyl-[acyl-carrier-protein]-phospholipid O-acyltransferase / long-chain-fatty-acid--[acyl-carrier-protein] ligase